MGILSTYDESESCTTCSNRTIVVCMYLDDKIEHKMLGMTQIHSSSTLENTWAMCVRTILTVFVST